MQPLLKPGSETALASSKQMGQAAYTLFQRCVVEKGLGGIAADIGVSSSFNLFDILNVFVREFRGAILIQSPSPGGDNNLNVVIADYAPHVRCDKPPSKGPPWESCLLILADMPATVDRKVFGVKSQDARVEVNVPYYLKASE